MLDVVQAIDGDEPAFRWAEIRQNGPLAASPAECLRPCGVARVMAAAEKAWQRSLAGVSVADLAQTVDAESGRTALTALQGWLAEA